MELQRIYQVQVLARVGNFTEAAEELFMSQSSLSKQIKNLENELGHQLFIREKRALRLTRAGKLFLLYGQKILDPYEDMLHMLASAPLTIAITPVMKFYGVTDLLTAFANAHPSIEFSITQCDNIDGCSFLQQQKADMVVMHSAHLLPHSQQITLCQDGFAMIVPDTQLWRDKKSLEDFQEAKFILLGKETQVDGIIAQEFARVGIIPDILFQGSDAHIIAQLIASGTGITVMLSHVAQKLCQLYQGITCIPLEMKTRVSIALVRSGPPKMSASEQALWDFFDDHKNFFPQKFQEEL